MSSGTPAKGHRQTQSGAIPGIVASSQNPQNPHHLKQHPHAVGAHSGLQNYNLDSVSQPSTPPRTPRKDNELASHLQSGSAASGTGSKQKSRNKNRPKNVLTSPITTRKDRNTPPFSGMQSVGIPLASKPMNTPTTAAYAGPTFHASPAPSALPIPSFYSKSVPDSPSAKGLRLLKNNHSATPPHPTPPNQSQREQSPLDFFFKADREEKARAHNASQMAAAIGPFPPPDEAARSSQIPPTVSNHSQARQGSTKRMSAGGIFAMEMDVKEAGTPYGPAFSTPYSERINAARNNQQSRPSEQPIPRSRSPLTKSEALKAYLFSGTAMATTAKPENSISSGLMTANTYPSPPATCIGAGSAQLPQHPYIDGYQHMSGPKHQSSGNRTAPRSSGLRQEVVPTKPHIVQYHNTFHKQAPNSSQSLNNALFSDLSQGNPPQHMPASTAGSSENRSADLRGMEDSLRKILKLDSTGGSAITRKL